MVTTSTAQATKLAIMHFTGLSKDALHVYVGLIVFLSVAVLLNKPLRFTIPWLSVLLVATLGEVVDRHDDMVMLGYWRITASIHDVVNTLFWPTVFLIMAKYRVLFKSAK